MGAVKSPDELTVPNVAFPPEVPFTDQLMPGARATYAVRAVDKSGNASPLSSPIQETAR